MLEVAVIHLLNRIRDPRLGFLALCLRILKNPDALEQDLVVDEYGYCRLQVALSVMKKNANVVDNHCFSCSFLTGIGQPGRTLLEASPLPPSPEGDGEKAGETFRQDQRPTAGIRSLNSRSSAGSSASARCWTR